MTFPPIHHHPNPLQTLTPHLTPYLPRSLPLLRRLQFHFQSPHARTFATFPPTSIPPQDEIWSTAFIDRSRAPETEGWIFTSYEATKANQSDDVAGTRTAGAGAGTAVSDDALSTNKSTTEKLVIDKFATENLVTDELATNESAIARTQLHALLRTIRTQTQHPTNTHADPDTIILGAVHESTASLLSSVVQRRSEPWLTFLYRVDYPAPATSAADSEALLSSLNLRWSTVAPDEFALVRSRTAIPRSDSTLGLLASVGLRESERRLVGWAFLGVDGSLASLHVEPEIRGRGVGRVVAKRVLEMLWKEGVFEMSGVEREVGWRWGFSHAGVENAGSIAVAKALGGRLGWTDYWITVDLEAC